MLSEVDPSTLCLTPHDLNKISKKELAKHLSTLQGMYTERGRKYDKAKSIIRNNRSMTKTKDVELILKPRGRRSRDFKIIEAMQADGKVEVSRNTYKSLLNYVRFAVDVSLDKELPFKDQEMAELVKVIASVKAKYPFIEKYHNAWPVNMLIQQYLNNHRNNLRAKAAADEGTPDVDPGVAGPSTATPTAGPDNDNDDDDDDDDSDVTISDIDN